MTNYFISNKNQKCFLTKEEGKENLKKIKIFEEYRNVYRELLSIEHYVNVF